VAVMFRAELISRSGLFEPSVVYCTDMDLWLRLLLHGDLHFISESLAYYRIHKGSTGKALREKTVQDFMHVVDRIEEAGGMRFSPFERLRMAAKSSIKSRLRQAVYGLLA
jgi:GT2 family glycosyltransferase